MAKAESKTILKAYSTVESKLPTLPLEDGQLIFVYDKKKIILDNRGVRTVYEQIQTIETEEQRNDLLAPIDSFYFVIETSILWRYTNGHWNQITTSPQEQIDRIATEGTKQVKAVRDEGQKVLQSIPEDFQTQMETKLNKQQGIENKGKALVIGEDGNVVPGEVSSGGGDGIAIINTMSGESPLVIPDSAERVNKRLELGGKTEQVQTTGAQLLPFPYVTGDMTKNGVTFAVQEDGGIKVTGTATEFVIFNIAKIDFGANSIFNNSAGNGKVLSGGKDNVKIEYHGLNKNTYLSIEKGLTVNTVIYPQLQNGTAATPYEPYTGGKPSPSQEYEQEVKNAGKWNEGTQKYEVDVKVTNAEQNWSKEQTLTLTSDRPITKWDRLVEQGGQIGWLYASKKYVITGNEFFEYRSGYDQDAYTNRFIVINDLFVNRLSDKQLAYCKILKRVQYIYAQNKLEEGIDTNVNQLHIKLSNDRIGVLSSDDTETRTAKIAEYIKNTYTDGIEILYATTDTVFLPLPQSEQNAIRALKTYYPTTVITADGGELDPDIKVTYTADTKNYIDNKVSAKVASIIRQYRLNTANLLSLMPMETQAAMIENDTNNILENAEEMKHE